MTTIIDISKTALTPEEDKAILDQLTYACYRFNRQQFPNIPAPTWRGIFQNAEAMEARFNADTTLKNSESLWANKNAHSEEV